ncbi:MAG: GEVED domain-containing protein [Ferruginibacter sp.]
MHQFLTLLSALFFTAVSSYAQIKVTINASTPYTESFVSGPIYRPSASSNLDYSRYAYLYTAGELGSIPAGTLISSIAWNKTNSGATTLSGGGKFRIYLRNTNTVSSYTNTFMQFNNLVNGATLVYSNDNTVIPSTAGFLQFPFISPFVYTGSNLEVIVDWDISGVAGNPTTSSFMWQRTKTSKKIYGLATAAPTASDVMKPAGDSTGDITDTRPVVQFTLEATQPDCTVPPAGGFIAAPDSVCKGVNTILSVSGSSSGTQGLNYQWQSSTDNFVWTNIGAISDDSLIISQYNDLYYRRIISCGDASDTTDAKFIAVKPYAACVCVPALDNNTCPYNYIARVQLGTLDNSSECSPAIYTNYSDSVTAPDFYLTTSKFITITLGKTVTSTQYLYMYIDFNHDGLFNDNRYFLSTNNNTITATITIPADAQTGLTRMRLRYIPEGLFATNPPVCDPMPWRATETEDYLINILDFYACTNPPVNDITLASVSAVCSSDSILLSTLGANAGANYIYQWQSSADGNTWLDIEGYRSATCVMYQNAPRFYRTKISCADQFVYTTPVKVDMKPLIDCYCKFYRTSCSSPSNLIKKVVFGTLDHPSLCSPGGYINYSDSVAAPLLQSGTSVPIAVSIGNGLSHYVGVWIDYNRNGEFENSEYTSIGIGANTTLVKNIDIPAAANAGLTRMRVRERYDGALNSWDACNWLSSEGETEDYLVNIAGPKYCIPAGSSVCNNGDIISRVVFGNIDTSTTCSSNGYGNFTNGAQINTVTANSYVPLNVQVGCGNNTENVGVWIDFNQDGTFERNEFTLVGTGCSTTIFNDISIPTNAKKGLTTMRIRTTADLLVNPRTHPADACINYINGETEDYAVMVQPYDICPTNTWTGLGGDSNWDNAANWSCQQVPGVHSNVVINSGTVVVSSNVTIYSLNANPAATVTVVAPYSLVVTH